MASGRPATLTRARRAADSSRGTETSRGAERERWHSEAAQRRGPTEVALGGGQGAAGRAGFGRSQAILAGLGDRRGAQLSTRSPCRPPPGSRGPSSAYSRWLQLGTLGKVFCRSCPGRPCTRVLSTVQALRGQGQRWRSRLLCSPCELLRALRRPPGSASAFPPDHLPTRLTHYERCQVRALLPGPETLASDSRVSPTSQAPREL